MRDPKRIDEILGKIEKLWKNVPDWRFGQLMFNMFEGVLDTREPRFFHMQDDTAENILDLWIERFNLEEE